VTTFYYAVATIILLGACTAYCAVRFRTIADFMLAVQLVGTSGVALLLLLAVATRDPPVLDVALLMALLAAFSACALRASSAGPPSPLDR
jgi:multicomponent Na+:H+ antiporter subunit F